jgi:PAS domain-containing protein
MLNGGYSVIMVDAYVAASEAASEVDERRQLLALVEAQVGSLVDLLPVALLVTDAEGQIQRANAAAGALLGAAGSLIGRAIDDVLDGHELSIRSRSLCHQGEVVRLHVVQDGSS